MRRKVHDGIDIVRREDLVEKLRVTRIADDKLAGRDGCFEPGRQIVQSNNAFTRAAKLPDNVTTDIPGSTGN
jgi:hypothetical protein